MTNQNLLHPDEMWNARNDNRGEYSVDDSFPGNPLREQRKEECINKIDDLEIDLQAAYRDAAGDMISRIEEEIAELEEEIDRLTPYIPTKG